MKKSSTTMMHFGCSAQSLLATRRKAGGRTAGSRRLCPRSIKTWRRRSLGMALTRPSTGGSSTHSCKRGLEPVAVPSDTDYTMRLEAAGIGLPHSLLRGEAKLTERDIVCYLVHSRVTEQRASEQMRALRKYTADRPDISRAVRMISDDEDNHLAYCHEELLRLAEAGHRRFIERTLRSSALAESAIYRDVSTAVMARLGRILGWSRGKSVFLAAGIQAVYFYERLGGWRRMVSLRMPSRRNALGGRHLPATRNADTLLISMT